MKRTMIAVRTRLRSTSNFHMTTIPSTLHIVIRTRTATYRWIYWRSQLKLHTGGAVQIISTSHYHMHSVFCSIEMQDYLMTIQKHPIKSKFCKLRLLCRSLAGNNVYCLTVTAPVVDDELAKVFLHRFNTLPLIRSCSGGIHVWIFVTLYSIWNLSEKARNSCKCSCSSRWNTVVLDDERFHGLFNRRIEYSQKITP